MLNKKFLIDITREVLNHSENEYLRSDFVSCMQYIRTVSDMRHLRNEAEV